MVAVRKLLGEAGLNFQYSLCRVVLMVPPSPPAPSSPEPLSVLALSSRFDGQRG